MWHHDAGNGGRPSHQSSIPMIRAGGSGSMGTARIRRSSVSPLTGMARRVDSRAPGFPPTLNAMVRCASASLCVRRTRGGATAGKRSAKMRRGQSATAHRNRRTRRWSSPTRSCQGRSPSRRLYRLWTRRDERRHSGHAAVRARTRATTTTRSASTSTCSTTRLAGSNENRDLDTETGALVGTSFPLCAHSGFDPHPGCTGNADGPLFFRLRKGGQGPREMLVGSEVRISIEAAADWRRARTAVRLRIMSIAG